MTHSARIPLTQSSLPPSLTSLTRSCQHEPGESGLPGICVPPANLGGSGWAGECRQASGGLGADHVVSCRRDCRVLGGQSSASQVDPVPSPAEPRRIFLQPPPCCMHTGLAGPAAVLSGKLSHASTWALGPVVTMRHLSPDTSDMVSFPGCPTSSLCPLSKDDTLIRVIGY